MTWRVHAASVPKDDADANQDAWHASGNVLAVADGASSGYESGAWARLLAESAACFSEIVRIRLFANPEAPGA